MSNIWFELQKLSINESIEDRGILKACFMGGSPGAGKSYSINKVKSGQIEPRIVNTDKFTEFLAASMNVNVNQVMDDWSIYKENIKSLTKNQLALYLNSMLPLWIDGTSSNPPAVFRRTGILKSIGYDTAFMWVETSLETALERNKKRDRQVPEDFLKETYRKIQDLKPYYKSEFKYFFEIKNDEGELNDAAVLKSYRKVSSFFDGPVENPIGKQLIESMRSEGHKYLIDNSNYDMSYLKSLVSSWYKK